MRQPISHKIPKIYFVVPALAVLLFLSCDSRSGSDAPVRTEAKEVLPDRVNINRATARELELLPSIGPTLAAKIVDHRERFGPFRRIEQLMLIDGVSDKRFRQMRRLLTVD